MDKIKRLIYQMGSKPHQSWNYFLMGLGLFVFGAGLVYWGPKTWLWLQVPGLMILVIAFYFAAKGYLGIFANRFAQSISPPTSSSSEEK